MLTPATFRLGFRGGLCLDMRDAASMVLAESLSQRAHGGVRMATVKSYPKTRRRRFTRKERLALAIAAGFRCEKCGEYLHQFDADHTHPWSKGGDTHVRNGQALCAACNRRKGAKT
jgi:5-methylcytosine-specific restriction endonuclease McrA